jgi:hypothetical protein
VQRLFVIICAIDELITFFSLHRTVLSLEAGCKEGITPLIRASIKGHSAVVELLLAKGANVNQGAVAIHDYLCDQRGNRLLSYRHSTLYPQAGIHHVTTIHHGTTPLYLAAEYGHFAVVKILVANCANVNQGALAIHDYLSNVNEGIAYCPSTTPFHLRKQAETMALLHCTWLPQMETWRLCCCCLPRVRTSTKV